MGARAAGSCPGEEGDHALPEVDHGAPARRAGVRVTGVRRMESWTSVSSLPLCHVKGRRWLSVEPHRIGPNLHVLRADKISKAQAQHIYLRSPLFHCVPNA